MQEVLHNWSDADCMKVLKNCLKALPDDGKLIVIEQVIPKKIDEAKNALLLDIVMLTFFTGGKERTEQEYQFLAKESGFSKVKFVCNIYSFSVMEFYK